MANAKLTRTCVVCREKAEKSQLLKFTAVQIAEKLNSGMTHEAVFDAGQKKFGRSAYCHANSQCLSSPKLERLIMSGLNRRRQTDKPSKRIDRSGLELQIAEMKSSENKK